MVLLIRSKQNEKIKFIDKLKKASHRKKFGAFIIEGYREIFRAYDYQFVSELFFCPALFSDIDASQALIEKLIQENISVTEVTPEVYRKISLRENGDGLIALGVDKKYFLSDWAFKPNPLFLVTENIEKPSNFGAIIRTAESAGVDGIIVLDRSTEIFNPNVIRNSQGAVFFAPIYHATTEEFLKFAEAHGITIFVTTPHTQNLYFNKDFSKGSAILVGSESYGVTSRWLGPMPHQHLIAIPQNGSSDSLNVSVATAIVLYECVRQRMLKFTH